MQSEMFSTEQNGIKTGLPPDSQAIFPVSPSRTASNSGAAQHRLHFASQELQWSFSHLPLKTLSRIAQYVWEVSGLKAEVY